MPQEDRIYSTGREAIESLRDDYRDFNDDPDESFEEFAGDVLDIFNAAPVFLIFQSCKFSSMYNSRKRRTS